MMDGNQPLQLDNRGTNKFSSQCNLKDVHVLHHEMPPPPSYARGNSKIDYIWISKNLVLALHGSGSLALGEVNVGDHIVM